MGSGLKTNWDFKKAVKDAGLTLAQLGKKVGINKSILSGVGTGRYVLDNRQRRKITRVINAKTGLNEDEIFGG